MNRQQAKEAATLLAIRQGFGLVRRDKEIHAISAAGLTKRICSANQTDLIWHEALKVLGQRKGSPMELSRMRVDPYTLPQDSDDGWEFTTRGASEGIGIKSS